MPSVSGWALRHYCETHRRTVISNRFYALGFGLGFATHGSRSTRISDVSMPSVSGWALRPIEGATPSAL